MGFNLFSKAAEAVQSAAKIAGEVADTTSGKIQEAANAVGETASGAVKAIGGAAASAADGITDAIKNAQEEDEKRRAQELSTYHVETNKALQKLSEKDSGSNGELACKQTSKGVIKLPLAELAALGAGFASLSDSFRQIAVQSNASIAGGETLYRWSAPSIGAVPFARGDGAGFLSATTGANGLTQGAFVPVDSGFSMTSMAVAPIDPMTLFIAAAVVNMDRKLDDIKEAQQAILDFIEDNEKAKHIGNINALNEITDTYQHNWNNEKFKEAKLHLVQQIKKDSEQAIVFRRGRISKAQEDGSLIHGDISVNSKLETLSAEFDQYQLALYEFAHAWFLEVMLLENFEEGYLQSVRDKLQRYSLQYRELYTECFDGLIEKSATTVESMLLGGVSIASNAIGSVIGSIPVLKDGPVDEALIDASSKIGDYRYTRIAESLAKMKETGDTRIKPFIDSVDGLNALHNEPIEVFFDSDEVTFKLPE